MHAEATNERHAQIVEARPLPCVQGHPWFAATYDILTSGIEQRVFGPLRAQVVGAASGQVLEIGAGTGANFQYYGSAVATVVATEPDPFMIAHARRCVRQLDRALVFVRCPGEALPFADASFDTAVATLVLCTVTDPAGALAEVRRVLKPEGAFHFLEHIRACGVAEYVQDLIMPIQSRLAAGCHPNRRTGEAIKAAGFTIVRLEQHRLPLMPLILGVAQLRS